MSQSDNFYNADSSSDASALDGVEPLPAVESKSSWWNARKVVLVIAATGICAGICGALLALVFSTSGVRYTPISNEEASVREAMISSVLNSASLDEACVQYTDRTIKTACELDAEVSYFALWQYPFVKPEAEYHDCYWRGMSDVILTSFDLILPARSINELRDDVEIQRGIALACFGTDDAEEVIDFITERREGSLVAR